MRVGLRYLPMQRLLNILSHAATNHFLRQFPLFHLWSVIPGEQRETRNPGAFGCPSASVDLDRSRLILLAKLAARAIRRDGPCLLHSLILFWLLKARGEEAELLIGVRKEESALSSHAWIETRGTTIGDSAEMTASFARLVRL